MVSPVVIQVMSGSVTSTDDIEKAVVDGMRNEDDSDDDGAAAVDDNIQSI